MRKGEKNWDYLLQGGLEGFDSSLQMQKRFVVKRVFNCSISVPDRRCSYGFKFQGRLWIVGRTMRVVKP